MGEGGEKRRWDKVGQGTPDAGPTTTSESIMSLPLGAEVGRVTCSTKNSLSYVCTRAHELGGDPQRDEH